MLDIKSGSTLVRLMKEANIKQLVTLFDTQVEDLEVNSEEVIANAHSILDKKIDDGVEAGKCYDDSW